MRPLIKGVFSLEEEASHSLSPSSLKMFKLLYSFDSSEACFSVPPALAQRFNLPGTPSEDGNSVSCSQKIFTIRNNFTFEQSLFNPDRAARPGLNERAQDVDSISEAFFATGKSCDFCDYSNCTAVCPFGRIETRYSVTASNIGKYDCYHALVMSRQHNSLLLSSEEMSDCMLTARLWFQQAFAHYLRTHAEAKPSNSPALAAYPHLMWDLLPKASASQLHHHMQISLNVNSYYGKFASLLNTATRFSSQHKCDYFDALFTIHQELGLGFDFEGVRVCACLTPAKEQEILVTSPSLTEAFGKVLHAICQGYYAVGSFALSLAMVCPPLQDPSAAASAPAALPVLARVIDRGDPFAARADTGAMEYFGCTYITSDPFRTAGGVLGHAARLLGTALTSSSRAREE
eukprot:GCRY01000400.1.p1 GENE.GCRY01000400.1~~GCRY01000400.1.p1  ORF type:complete len:403 (+),score=93.08 GCRY01000400.1:98-1306(+)